MFTCTQCGEDLHGKVSFCPQCGSRVTKDESASVQQRLIEISRAVNSTLDLDILLEKINVCACELTNAEAGSTMLHDPEKDELYFKVALGEKADILRRLTVRDGVAWRVFKSGRPYITNDAASDPTFTGTVDNVTGFKTKNIMCVPIILVGTRHAVSVQPRGSVPAHGMEPGSYDEIIGVIEVFNKLSDPPYFNVEDQKILSIFAYQAAIAVRNAKEAGDRRNFFVNAIEIFITAIESTGFVPPGHCMRVARISMSIAHKLAVEGDDLNNLYYASVLHDIGMLDIRCRQSPVSSGNCPESHAIIGAGMVRPVSLLAKTEPIIRHHHEAWDGTGYPDGISGDDIPLGARIVAVAEAYEEIGSERDFIAANAGRLFDPDVVDAFLEMEL